MNGLRPVGAESEQGRDSKACRCHLFEYSQAYGLSISRPFRGIALWFRAGAISSVFFNVTFLHSQTLIYSPATGASLHVLFQHQ